MYCLYQTIRKKYLPFHLKSHRLQRNGVQASAPHKTVRKCMVPPTVCLCSAALAEVMVSSACLRMAARSESNFSCIHCTKLTDKGINDAMFTQLSQHLVFCSFSVLVFQLFPVCTVSSLTVHFTLHENGRYKFHT